MSDSSDDMEFYSGFCDDEDEEFVEKEQYDALLAQNKLLVEALEKINDISWGSASLDDLSGFQCIFEESKQALSKVKGEG